jgi:DNA modification methylase
VIHIKKADLRNTRAHPTEKPLELYKWLLERYCPKDGCVLDPTAGSFNSIKVAKELGLKGIGIEKDDKFFETAKKFFDPPVVEEVAEQAPVNVVVYN